MGREILPWVPLPNTRRHHRRPGRQTSSLRSAVITPTRMCRDCNLFSLDTRPVGIVQCGRAESPRGAVGAGDATVSRRSFGAWLSIGPRVTVHTAARKEREHV